ncbi:MAG: N-acetyltransferase [Calothrix sp. C42_A2020_038]|nr:N-acetyltransferase [Calothrix sp. C42_A2020_038]
MIRFATVDDAALIQAIYAPFCISSPITFETEAPTVEEMQQRITKIQVQYPWLVYCADEQVLGYAYAAPHHERAAYQWSVNVSVYIHETARRMGIGSSLYKSLFEILKLQGYYNAYAGVTQPNIPSMRLHESMGFQYAGTYINAGYKCGAWHDVIWLRLALQPLVPNPKPPISVKALVSTEGQNNA